MSDKTGTAAGGGGGGGFSSRFTTLSSFVGESLSQKAHELSAKAAAELKKASSSSLGSSVATGTGTHNNENNNENTTATSASATTTSTSTTNASQNHAASTSPQQQKQHSQQELLTLLQQMNQKVKVLSLQKQQLMNAQQPLLDERNQLRDLIVDEILNGLTNVNGDGLMNDADAANPSSTTSSVNIAQLRAAWRRQDEQNALALQQLQSEFQSLRLQQLQKQQQQEQEQQQQDKAQNNESWEADRNALIQHHEHELTEMRDFLQHQIEQLQHQLQLQTETKTNDKHEEDTTEQERIQSVKDAAQAQIEALKKKFILAHNQGLSIAKAEWEQAQACAFEQQRATLTESHQQRLQELRQELELHHEQQLTEQLSVELKRQEEMAQATLAQEIERVRQEVEQTVTTEMEEKLQSLLGDLKRQHQLELEQQLQQVQIHAPSQPKSDTETNNSKWEDLVQELQQQLSTVKQEKETIQAALRSELFSDTSTAENSSTGISGFESFDLYVDHLKDQIRSIKLERETALDAQQCELQQTASETVAQVIASKDSELAVLRESIKSSQCELAECRDRLQQQLESHSQDKETALLNLRTEMEQLTSDRVLETIETKQLELTQLREEMVSSQSKLHLEHDEKVSTLQHQLEVEVQTKQTTLDELQREWEARIAARVTELEHLKEQEMEQVKEAMRMEITSLQNQLSSSLHESVTKSQSLGLEHQLQSLQEKITLERQLHEQALDSAREESRSLVSKSLAEAKESFETEKQEILKTVVLERDRLMNDLQSDASAQLTALQQEYDAEKQSLQYLLEESESALRDARLAVATITRESDELRNRLEEERVDKDSERAANEEISILREKSSQLLSQITVLDEDKRSLMKQLEEMTLRLEEASSNAQSTRSQHADKLTQARLELQSQIDALEEERQSLLASVNELEVSRSEIEAQFIQLKESHDREIERLQSEVQETKLTAQTEKETTASEKKGLQDACKAKDAKLTQFVDRLKSVTAHAAMLKKENEGLNQKLESEIKVQESLRLEIQSLQQSIDETVKNGSEAASSLLRQQETLVSEKAALQRQVSELKTSREELLGKVQAITANLDAMVEQREIFERRIASASKTESKLLSSEAEVANLREQVNKLKLDLTHHNSLLSRLEADKDANERSQGERSAFVGMLEGRMSELNDKIADLNAKLKASLYDLSQKNEELQSSEDRVQQLESELVESRASVKRTKDALAIAQKGTESKISRNVEALQKELRNVQQQMVKKSAAAQKLIRERESECSELRSTISLLQQEVDKGSLSDRRIFDMAAKQSNRESLQKSEIEIRDNTIESMKTALLSRDGDLAFAEKKVLDIESEVEELCRVRRREDVNLDYLKSIVVKYLSLPPGSSERARLLPVLATLLQFNPQDYQTIEEGKNKVCWWGNVAPTLITAPVESQQYSGATNAEISVSRAPPSQTRPTSLQF